MFADVLYSLRSFRSTKQYSTKVDEAVDLDDHPRRVLGNRKIIEENISLACG
jgi:hypothetical protein